ncbi:hypothetical protein [Ammoniphilus sp. CFH 90114]|nr:hypothetical protein [Ammoniphilus sp. CFH 90114]
MELDKDSLINELAQFQRATITQQEVNEIFMRHLQSQGYSKEDLQEDK